MPDTPEGIVRMALGQGAPAMLYGKVEMSATDMVHFFRLQREISADKSSKASERPAAQAMNHMLTALRRYLEPDAFYALQDEAWPGLMETMRGVQAPPG